MQGVNLIPAHRRAVQQHKRRLRAWIRITAIYGGLVIGACGTIRMMGDHHDSAAAAELTHYEQQIDQLNSRLADLRRQLSEAEISRRTAIAISDQPDWSILFPILGNSVGDDVVLREIQLKPDIDPKNKAQQQSFNLQLRGFAKSQPGVSQFVLRLQQLNLFDEVKLLRTGREPVNSSQAVTFEISCALREGSAGRKP